MADKRKPSNARVESLKYMAEFRPKCHPDSLWRIVHMTLEGMYEIKCAACGDEYLRIDVGRAR